MEMCRIVTAAGADFIKTSTGYGSRGASPEDIRLFRKYLKKPARRGSGWDGFADLLLCLVVVLGSLD